MGVGSRVAVGLELELGAWLRVGIGFVLGSG